MSIVNSILTSIGDLLLGPWTFTSPWPALVFASLVASGVLVGLFRLSSNQTAMRRGRDQLFARVLELLLFRHDLGVSLSACGRIAAANVRYLSAFAFPMLVSLLPLWCLFTQMEAWFEHRPLRVGETAVVEIELAPPLSVMSSPLKVTTSASLQPENSGIRIPLQNELCLNLRAMQLGQGWVEFQVGDLVERRPVLIETRLARVATERHRSGWWQGFLNPTARPLTNNSPLVRFDVRYPARQLLIGDREVHWTSVAFVLIMVFSLAIGKVFGIRIA